MKNNLKTKNASTAFMLILFSVFLTASCMVIGAQESYGGTEIGTCMVDRYNATKPASVSSLNCTSNDVSLAIYEIVGDETITCIPGTTVADVVLKGNFIATSNERWDVGVFISQDGGTPNALGGVCYSDYLHPVSSNNSDLELYCDHTETPCSTDAECTGDLYCDDHETPCTTDADCTGTILQTCSADLCNTLSAGAGPYYNGEITEDPADDCGDIQQNVNNAYITDPIDILCQDNDDDGFADVTSCTVWANSRSNGDNKPSCSDEADVTAETTAKCTCQPVNIIGIEIEQDALIEVVKDLIPSSDTGLFNLQIEGVNEATNIGDGGTTGPVIVGAGTNQDPGADYDVGETAGTGTSLDSYVTLISCVDRGLTTFDGGPPLTQSGAGPLNVPVDPDDNIVCTITNTNKCNGVSCPDTDCGIGSCEVIGGAATCTYAPKTQYVCRAAADVCDEPEECNGTTDVGACPADSFTTGGVCRAAADVCDEPEECTGASAACPADNFTTGGVCRAAADVCDEPEECTGASAACPADNFTTGGVCRAAADVCDKPEECTGASAACPADGFTTGGVCRAAADVCDEPEECTGASAACPADGFTTGGVCRAAADVCDEPEECTGASAACPTDGFVAAGTECFASTGECDLAEVCTGSSAACPADGANLTTECRASTGVCDPAEFCSDASDFCPDDVILPCEECLTHTGGYWGTHPWATIEFLPVTSCGLEVNNVDAYTTGDKVDTAAYGSAIEDICFGGKDIKRTDYSPQQTQLIRQCTVAAINMAATSYFEGSCDGYVIPENECIPVDVPCIVDVGQCADGSGTCTIDADCAYSYCSQGGGPAEADCQDNSECPDNPFTLWSIPDVMASCCDTPEGGPEALCTSGAPGSVISSSGCIEALDMFNNSEDTFDIDPDLCEFSPDENCSADNDACKDSSNNGWMNCRGDLGDNPACGECGDGYVRGTEECDDGNNDNGDGCDENCIEEI